MVTSTMTQEQYMVQHVDSVLPQHVCRSSRRYQCDDLPTTLYIPIEVFLQYSPMKKLSAYYHLARIKAIPQVEMASSVHKAGRIQQLNNVARAGFDVVALNMH